MAGNLSQALPGDLVWIPDRREQATVRDEMAPRSCEMEIPSGAFRRYKRDIVHLSGENISPGRTELDSDSETTSEGQSHSGESGGGLPSPPTHSPQRVVA